MNCNGPPAEDLVAWLDGECDAALASRVAAHLAACAPCRREAAALRESGELIARLPRLAPSAGFAARVVAAARPASTATAPRGRLHLFRPRVAAAAAAVLVGTGAWWVLSAGPETGGVLTAREEEALAADLAVISNLDALQSADAAEIAQLVDDLDVIDGLASDTEGG